MLHSVKRTAVQIGATALVIAATALTSLPKAVAAPADLARHQHAVGPIAAGRGANPRAQAGESPRDADLMDRVAPGSTYYQLPEWIDR
jgi:hypothetical protein